jgi:hypothetical protein
MSSVIRANNSFDFVSVDCLLDRQPCVHDCKGKIEEARLNTTPLENRIDQFSSKKPFYFSNQDRLVHAYCWIQAANNRSGCSDCKKTFEQIEQKIEPENSTDSQKRGFCSWKRVGMVAAVVLVLFTAAALYYTSQEDAYLDDFTNTLGTTGTRSRCFSLGSLFEICRTKHINVLGSVSDERTIQFPLFSEKKYSFSPTSDPYSHSLKCWNIPFLFSKCVDSKTILGATSSNTTIEIPFLNKTITY